MLVRELVAYARTRLKDQRSDRAFGLGKVRFLIEIDEKGRFLGVSETQGRPLQRGKKELPQPKEFHVPQSPVARNSPTMSFPLLAVDGIKYVLGVGAWTKEEDRDKPTSRLRHQAFVELIGRAAKETEDPALAACALFYALPEQVESARSALAEKSAKEADAVGFSLATAAGSPDVGGPVFQRAKVQNWWREHHRNSSEDRVAGSGTAMCLACGRTGGILPTHDKIKGLGGKFGGQSAGVALMSFDKDAYQSHGWDKNANSPVCPECAADYILALNYLLGSDNVPRTRVNHGGVAFVFWTREPPGPLDPINILEEARPEDVEALLRAVHAGGGGTQVRSDEFFGLAASGNGGRLVVRDWFTETVDTVRRNVGNWFRSLSIVDVFTRGPSRPPKLWQVIGCLVRGGEADDVPSPTHVELIRRALRGFPLGRATLARALARLRAESGRDRLSPVRMGLVRLCVNDLAVSTEGAPTMTETLNPELSDSAYLCGRLLAVYDSLQYQAQGDVNASVVDRYWSLASTYPALAFPKIVDLGMKHMRKLRRDRRGAAVNIEKEIQGICARMGDAGGSFPAQLSLEEQGRFAIGFYHEKAEIQARIQAAKEAREAKELAQGATVL